MIESDSYEIKTLFQWGNDGQEYDILKTIVSFANCNGGTIQIDKVEGDKARLDSARLDDFVNKYVSPRIGGITSQFYEDKCFIIVGKSPYAPHVIKNEASYQKGGKTKSAFHQGQVYVRHSSKSEPATGEDLQALIRDGVSSWLQSLGEAVAKVGISTNEELGMPVRIVDGGPGISISIGDSHPYTAAQIGKEIGKTGSWIGKAINNLGFRKNQKYCIKIPGYAQPIYRYSQACKDALDKHLAENPDFNPYKKN